MTQQALASPVEIVKGINSDFECDGNPFAFLPCGTYGSILTVIQGFDTKLKFYNANFYAYLNSDYKVVIGTSVNTLFITWTDPGLMRLLGFRNNLPPSASHTATDTPGKIWLPPYYSADMERFASDAKISGANAIDGSFSGIALAPGCYERTVDWRAVAAKDTYKAASVVSYDYSAVTYYPGEERCLETFTLDALTAVPTGTEGLSIKGAYYIEDMSLYTGVGNLPSSMDGGGYRFHLTTDPDNYIFCHLRSSRWKNPQPSIDNHNSLYDVSVELISSIDGCPTWSKP